MKGIILAGGSGTRLYPITEVTSKQLLPVYDKPMIYYPLSTLMLAGIREILVISTPADLGRFQALLGNGQKWGIQFSYAAQPRPAGIAEAFIIGKQFIGSDSCALILGDNLFYGEAFLRLLLKAVQKAMGATVFAYPVHDPERYGIVEFNEKRQPIAIIEKPKNSRSRYAVTGLYIYDNQAIEVAESLTPSARGELEISDITQYYLNKGQLEVLYLGRGEAWLDTGTFESLLEASEFIHTLEKRQGLKIACPEEIAYRMGYISAADLAALAQPLIKNGYGAYLLEILNSENLFYPMGK